MRWLTCIFRYDIKNVIFRYISSECSCLRSWLRLSINRVVRLNESLKLKENEWWESIQSNLQKSRAHNLLMIYMCYYYKWDYNLLSIYLLWARLAIWEMIVKLVELHLVMWVILNRYWLCSCFTIFTSHCLYRFCNVLRIFLILNLISLNNMYDRVEILIV